MYSIDNVKFKHLSPILDLEVPIRDLYKAVAALIQDHTSKSVAFGVSYGQDELNKHAAISNQQGELGNPPAADAHDLEKEFYKAKDVYFGLAMKDVFLAAAIKGAVTTSEIRDYVDPSIRTQETVDLLKEIGMPTLASIISFSYK